MNQKQRFDQVFYYSLPRNNSKLTNLQLTLFCFPNIPGSKQLYKLLCMLLLQMVNGFGWFQNKFAAFTLLNFLMCTLQTPRWFWGACVDTRYSDGTQVWTQILMFVPKNKNSASSRAWLFSLSTRAHRAHTPCACILQNWCKGKKLKLQKITTTELNC